jgi:glycosyltransferase involved in cell wall biosynthesis
MARITVLFSTLNGAHTLPRMLDTLERLEPPASGWKVVAVDNGSADESLHILQQRAAKLPVTVIEEPRRGKNIALNSGLALVEGDIVAFTDDDVILPRDWLVAIERVAAEHADYDVFGGPISLVWEEPPPDWVLRCVPKNWLGLNDFPEGQVDANSIYGANMAVRTTVFPKHKFAAQIGPDGSAAYAMGSETEFMMRVERSGHRCWHFQGSPVGHIIRPYQLRREWLLQRAYNTGRGNRRRLRMNNQEDFVRLFGHPLRHLLGLVKGAGLLGTAACNVAISRLFRDSEDQFRASLRLRYCQGDFDERYAVERTRRRSARDRHSHYE